MGGAPYRLEEAYLVSVHVPSDEVDAVLDALGEALGLRYGDYERVAFVDPPGTEQYATAGGELARVTTSRVSFSVPRDRAQLDRALSTIRAAHGYEEPVVLVREILRTRSLGGERSLARRWLGRVTARWRRSRRRGP